MSSVIRDKITKTGSFPEDVDARIAAILSGVANIEPKAITLLLTDKSPKTSTDISKEFIALTGSVWKPKHSAIAGYCRQSLVPIGMVAEEDLQYFGHSKWRSYFTSSEAGEYYGKPIAAFVLRKTNEYSGSIFAERHGIKGRSMIEIFGSANSVSDNRSPFNTYTILSALSEHKTMRRTDIANATGMPDRQIEPHLRRLKNVSFVEYESIDEGSSGWARYSWIAENNCKDVLPYDHEIRLTGLVVKHLQKAGEADCHEIQRLLETEDNYKRSLTNITSVLSHIKYNGFATAHFSGHKRSEAYITELGRFFLNDFLARLECALKDGNDLQSMKSCLLDYCADPDKLVHDASNAVAIYQAAREDHKYGSMEQKCNAVYRLLSSGIGMRPAEIAEELYMGESSVFDSLKQLVKKGIIYAKKSGNVAIYKLTDCE